MENQADTKHDKWFDELLRDGSLAFMKQQDLYELLINAKNEWNRRFETGRFPALKKAYLHFENK